jgi:hypothetical protein
VLEDLLSELDDALQCLLQAVRSGQFVRDGSETFEHLLVRTPLVDHPPTSPSGRVQVGDTIDGRVAAGRITAADNEESGRRSDRPGRCRSVAS